MTALPSQPPSKAIVPPLDVQIHLAMIHGLDLTSDLSALAKHVLTHWQSFVGEGAVAALVDCVNDLFVRSRAGRPGEGVETLLHAEVLRRAQDAGMRIMRRADYLVEIDERPRSRYLLWSAYHTMRWQPGRRVWVIGPSNSRYTGILPPHTELESDTIHLLDIVSHGLFSHDMGVCR